MSICVLHSDFVWQSQFQEFVSRVEDMCSPVAQCTHTKIIPTTPLSQMIIFIILVIRSNSEPSVPIQIFRQLLTGRKFINISVPFMPTTWVIHVGSDSSNVFDNSRIHPGFKLKIVCFRMSLISYLSNQVRTFKRSLHQQFRFIESTCQRFLHIYMLSGSQSQHTDRKMRMVRSSNCYSIKFVTGLIKHLAKIPKLLCFRIFSHYLLCMLGTHIYIT